MKRTNRNWLPEYCNPDAYLPKIQETRTLFSRPPFLFLDFVGRAISFLKSDEAKKRGFIYDPSQILPCKWKCSDESVFGVDLCIYSYTGQYPFDKGKIGGFFNESSLGAAVHHGGSNIDFGGSHVGYQPGEKGGKFGHIWRPQHREFSTDCGHLMNLVEPFKKVYDDASQNIHIFNPIDTKVLVSIPNEYIQPNWSSQPIKLLVDIDSIPAGEVRYQKDKSYTHTPIGRSLFYLNPDFLDNLPEKVAESFMTPEPVSIGRYLNQSYFNVFDADAKLDEEGLPVEKLNLYMKYIISAMNSPHSLKAAVVNTNLEYNRLTDAVRQPEFKDYSFASFTGVFIDIYDHWLQNYINLFQPLGLSIKPGNTTHCTELTPGEIYDIMERYSPDTPVRHLKEVMAYDSPEGFVEQFSFKPGYFR